MLMQGRVSACNKKKNSTQVFFSLFHLLRKSIQKQTNETCCKQEKKIELRTNVIIIIIIIVKEPMSNFFLLITSLKIANSMHLLT